MHAERTYVRMLRRERQKNSSVAIRGFDPRTFGLWAQRATAAPNRLLYALTFFCGAAASLRSPPYIHTWYAYRLVTTGESHSLQCILSVAPCMVTSEYTCLQQCVSDTLNLRRTGHSCTWITPAVIHIWTCYSGWESLLQCIRPIAPCVVTSVVCSQWNQLALRRPAVDYSAVIHT